MRGLVKVVKYGLFCALCALIAIVTAREISSIVKDHVDNVCAEHVNE